ncbi:MAG: hypothetical protein O7I93_16535 [Gemmatimonadetes bacterium]|nr:hypothetical protein [Gemmatimonadota bacterium]
MKHHIIQWSAVAALTAILVGSGNVSGAGAQKVRIAVLGFENNSGWGAWGADLGKAATDELVTQLVRSGQFSVIERQQVEAILTEQDFGWQGRVNPATAAQFGEILGVQLVLLGSITQFSIGTKSAGIGPARVRFTEAETVLDVRVVNTSTAEIMSVAEGNGKKRVGGAAINNVNYEQTFDQGIAQEALRPAVEKVVRELVSQADDFASLAPVATAGNVVGTRDGSVYIDRGENFGVTVGQRFAVYRVVDEITDSHGNVLDRVTEKVGVVEVSRVLSQSSICVVVEGEASEGDMVKAEGS